MTTGDLRIGRLPANSLDQRVELLIVAHSFFSKGHNVHQDVILPQLLAQLDQTILRILQGRADKDDYTLFLILVLSVLEC